jgi:hypothetical protein
MPILASYTPFPAESRTTKSAEQAPAPPFATGTSGLLGACDAAKKLRAKGGTNTTSNTAKDILSEVRIRTPLEPRL